MTLYQQLPGTLDLSLIRGDNFSMQLDFNVDLTDYQFLAQLQQDNKTTIITVATVNAVDGIINISMTDTITAQLTTSPAKWFLRWTDAAGISRRILAGRLKVTA